jgi:HAD superfamily hydrolase (TIGR01509 family)
VEDDDDNRPIPIQGILLDLDGTLLDTETLSDHAMYAALNISKKDIPQLKTLHSNSNNNTDDIDNDYENFRLPWELKRQILGLRSKDWGPIVMKYAQDIWKLPTNQLPSTCDELTQQWEQYLNEYCGTHVQPCSGVYEFIQQISKLSIPMAIATSSQQMAVQQKRQHHEMGIFQYIPIIVCGDHPNVQNGKPAPDIYLEAARQLNIVPQHCLVVEDAKNGILSAKAAGCGCIVAIPDTRYHRTNEIEWFHQHADMVLPDLWHFNGTSIGINVDMTSLK